MANINFVFFSCFKNFVILGNTNFVSGEIKKNLFNGILTVSIMYDSNSMEYGSTCKGKQKYNRDWKIRENNFLSQRWIEISNFIPDVCHILLCNLSYTLYVTRAVLNRV